VIQLVLPLHECAAKPLQADAKSITDLADAADHTDTALTETFCLCVWV
jgi:hypothetical protein